MSDVIICVTMRFGSKRLPGKALIDLGGGVTPVDLITLQLGRLSHRLVFCCPEGEEGDSIAAQVRDPAECFRGSLGNVLLRMLDAAKHYGASSVVRVTGDDVFVDPGCLQRLVDSHVAAAADLTYSDLPKGTECQVMSVRLLRRMVEACGEDTECWDKERNATWAGDTEFNFVEISPVEATPSTFAVELDTREDAETIRDAIARLQDKGLHPPFLVKDLVSLHGERPFPKSKHPIYKP